MRKFTENDKLALAAALQTFIGYMNGSRNRTSTCLEYVNAALDAGLTVDELLNRENYGRVCEIIEKPDLGAYVNALIERSVIVRGIKDEDNWTDPDGFFIYAEMYHDFYQKINGTGGVYATATAKENLMKAISRNSMQALLSERLITDVMERSGKGEKLTCFNYLEYLLRDAESYDIDISLSEQQEARAQLAAESTYQNVETHEAPAGAEETEARDEDTDPSVTTETAGPENDDSIYHDWGEEDDSSSMDDNVAFISTMNPRQYKRNFVSEALHTLTKDELNEIWRFATTASNGTLDELIEDLTSGNIDKRGESVEARKTHQFLNSQLLQHFLNCIAMQGMQMSEQTAMKIDYLTESWDMRDNKTRKLQKIKELIYQNGMDDNDLLDVIEDLENLYQDNN